MSESTYIFTDTQFESELVRLQALEKVYDRAIYLATVGAIAQKAKTQFDLILQSDFSRLKTNGARQNNLYR